MNSKHVGPAALVATLIGLVGGGAYAANVAFQPTEKPAPVVNIAPAAETVEPTVTVAPSPTTTVAPAPVKSVKVAVSSTTKATTTSAPQTVQRQAIVSETPTDPTPTQTQAKPAPFGTNPANGAPNPPPVDRGTNDQPPPPPGN